MRLHALTVYQYFVYNLFEADPSRDNHKSKMPAFQVVYQALFAVLTHSRKETLYILFLEAMMTYLKTKGFESLEGLVSLLSSLGKVVVSSPICALANWSEIHLHLHFLRSIAIEAYLNAWKKPILCFTCLYSSPNGILGFVRGKECMKTVSELNILALYLIEYDAGVDRSPFSCDETALFTERAYELLSLDEVNPFQSTPGSSNHPCRKCGSALPPLSIGQGTRLYDLYILQPLRMHIHSSCRVILANISFRLGHERIEDTLHRILDADCLLRDGMNLCFSRDVDDMSTGVLCPQFVMPCMRNLLLSIFPSCTQAALINWRLITYMCSRPQLGFVYVRFLETDVKAYVQRCALEKAEATVLDAIRALKDIAESIEAIEFYIPTEKDQARRYAVDHLAYLFVTCADLLTEIILNQSGFHRDISAAFHFVAEKDNFEGKFHTTISERIISSIGPSLLEKISDVLSTVAEGFCDSFSVEFMLVLDALKKELDRKVRFRDRVFVANALRLANHETVEHSNGSQQWSSFFDLHLPRNSQMNLRVLAKYGKVQIMLDNAIRIHGTYPQCFLVTAIREEMWKHRVSSLSVDDILNLSCVSHDETRKILDFFIQRAILTTSPKKFMHFRQGKSLKICQSHVIDLLNLDDE